MQTAHNKVIRFKTAEGYYVLLDLAKKIFVIALDEAEFYAAGEYSEIVVRYSQIEFHVEQKSFPVASFSFFIDPAVSSRIQDML